MKQVFLLTALMTAALFAAAQTQSAPQQQPATQPAGAAAQKPSQPGASQPAQQTPPTAAQQGPAPGAARRPPQAKSQDEFKAFQDASSKTTAADTEAAANQFAAKFPDSELRVLLFRKAMYEYQSMNNADKAIELGRKMLQVDPNNPEALVMVATFLSEKTRETDLDRDERLAEATRDAQKALQTVETDLMLPANISAEQVDAIKKQMKSMAYGALGTIDIAKKNYPSAENNLRTATQMNATDPLNWLRLAYALDQQKKYQEALPPANNCIQNSADQAQVNNLCKAERDRLTKLVAAPPAAQPAPTAPQPTTVNPPE